MANKKITELTEITSGVDTAVDVLPIVDVSADDTKKITPDTLVSNIKDDKFKLQDNTDNTKQAQFQLSGITTATTRTLTVPDANTTIVGTDATQTLTNKTLTDPTINAGSGVVVLPNTASPAQTAEGSVVWDSNDDLLTVGDGSSRKVMVDTTSTQTLTNKTLTSPVISGTPTITGWDGWQSISATLTYSSADDPVYVVGTSSDLTALIGVGDRIKFTNNSTTFYGIVVAINATTITLYGGTDYDVANSAITNPFFSHAKAPVGFPLSPAKWSVTLTDATTRSQATPTQNTWYNLNSNSISIPIGIWDVYYHATPWGIKSAATSINCYVTLSTTNNGESDGQTWTASNKFDGASATLELWSSVQRRGIIDVSSKTSYYLNARSTVASMNSIALLDTKKIVAVCAYL